jgi:hypothetical protein
MILLSLSHPLTLPQRAQLEALTGQRLERVIEAQPHFDPAQPFAPQTRAFVDSLGLTPSEWQSLPIVISPPALNWLTATLLADLHGRMGYFPSVVRLRAMPKLLPPLFEVAEVLSLQAIREAARRSRQ